MIYYVYLEVTCRRAGEVTLFAMIRLCSWVGSLVVSKIASCCARKVALCANKGLLPAVNQHVGFQAGRSVT